MSTPQEQSSGSSNAARVINGALCDTRVRCTTGTSAGVDHRSLYVRVVYVPVVPLVVPTWDPCPYCEDFAGRFRPHRPPAVIVEDDAVCVFLTRKPLGGMPGHTLVTTKRHVETIFDLTVDEEAALIHAVALTARTLRAALDPDGILIQQHNGEAAFQTVPHVHFHVVPKLAGLPFPPPDEPQETPVPELLQLAESLRGQWRQ